MSVTGPPGWTYQPRCTCMDSWFSVTPKPACPLHLYLNTSPATTTWTIHTPHRHNDGRSCADADKAASEQIDGLSKTARELDDALCDVLLLLQAGKVGRAKRLIRSEIDRVRGDE